MRSEGYIVYNTAGEDLDKDYRIVNNFEADCNTSFEVLEHLLAPYNLLIEIESGRLISSVPLNVWFSRAYWSKKDE